MSPAVICARSPEPKKYTPLTWKPNPGWKIPLKTTRWR